MKTINKEFFEKFNPNNEKISKIEFSKNTKKEVERLDEQAKEISAKIDLKESYAGIKTFDADLVISELNKLATFHENMSVRQRRYAKEDLMSSAESWAESADGHHQAAKDLRKSIRFIISAQKNENRILNR